MEYRRRRCRFEEVPFVAQLKSPQLCTRLPKAASFAQFNSEMAEWLEVVDALQNIHHNYTRNEAIHMLP